MLVNLLQQLITMNDETILFILKIVEKSWTAFEIMCCKRFS